MKIRALSRSSSSVQAAGSASSKAPRNLDPSQHPFAVGREYTRALNATKLSRSFAQPFLRQLGNGHVDGVYTVAQDPSSLQRLASGSGDGIVKVWDLTSREEVFQAKAHDNIVKGVAWSPGQERRLLTCGADKSIKVYEPYKDTSPIAEYLGKGAFTGITHHRNQPVFATSGSEISLWDLSRPSEKATSTLSWPTSVDTITTCAFNQTETSILASAGTDRSIVLYDIRTNSPLHRTVLSLATNAISWNPMEAFNFAAANEDHNVYIFDSRNLSRALNVLKGHVAAVMDVSFSPTGEELVTASYDRTVRLWNRSQGQSRDIYHSKRMQRVFSSLWTQDNNYIISGSDDGNIRLWRAQASSRSGVRNYREQQKLDYSESLKQRYAHMPEIKRISRHRHVPKVVKKAGEIKRVEVESQKRKDENVRKHSRKDTLPKRRSEREKMVLATEK